MIPAMDYVFSAYWLPYVTGRTLAEAMQKLEERVRLNRRTLAFYDKLSAELGVSRNAVRQMVLEHLVNTAVPAKAPSSPGTISE